MDTLLVKWRDYQPHLDQFSAYLSSVEQDRMQRFAHQTDRHRYIIARGLLYEGCAERLNVMPKDIEFALAPHDKPYVIDHDLHINLSHSVDWLLLGFDPHHPIGVDIQHHDNHDYKKLAQRFFHPEEQAQLKACAPEDIQKQFYAIWTQKEALVKASGQGIQFGLTRFSVLTPPEGFNMHQHEAPQHYSAATSTHIALLH